MNKYDRWSQKEIEEEIARQCGEEILEDWMKLAEATTDGKIDKDLVYAYQKLLAVAG